jgi:uroporphyrinogen-III synthase
VIGGLAGKRVVNTRAAHQAAELSALLRQYGATPVEYPCIEIAPPEDTEPLDAALRALAAGRFDWLVLTSANTVFALARHVGALGLSLNGAAFQTAAVGPATAQAAGGLGLQPVVLPHDYTAESLANAIPDASGARVLIPASALARPALSEIFTARGAEVATVCAYRTVCGQGGADVPRLLAQGQIDAIAFTSSSTVTFFVERLRRENGSLEDALPLCTACIGQPTAVTAREHGFTRVVVPPRQTTADLIGALDACFA